jgi:hypothetical protein
LMSKYVKSLIIISITFCLVTSTTMAAPVQVSQAIISSPLSCTNATIGNSDNGILVMQWNHTLFPRYVWGWFGSSAAITDLGPDVNTNGTEPDANLEIVVGSDELDHWYPELGANGSGIWRTFDSQGNIEWARDTETDEARSSPVIVDFDGDGNLEIAGGTTSGWNVEVMDRFGNWIWTFPWPPDKGGPYLWHSSPAIADINNSVAGLELVEGYGHEYYQLGAVFAFDGNNSDGIDEGISYSLDPSYWYNYPLGTGGTEGIDWDVLWVYMTGAPVRSTPAIGDVDNDDQLEVIVGSDDGNIYVLNGSDGSLEWNKTTEGAVKASPALANLDNDPYLEIVIGSMDSLIYCLEWNGTRGIEEWNYSTGGPVVSSGAIGDIDGDNDLEIVIGSCDNRVYSIGSLGTEEWNYTTNGHIISSAALADRVSVSKYDNDWPFFRHDVARTGFYGPAPSRGLDIYIGSLDNYLYLLDGNNGSMIDRFQTDAEIFTSPSVADADGDSHLEIFFYSAHKDWITNDTFWCIEDLGPENEPPVAIIHGGDERTVYEGDLVTFDGSDSYDLEGDIISYTWDFNVELDSDGDGNPGNDTDAVDPIVTYTWDDDFEVRVKLTVIDDGGLTNDTYQQVTVLNVDPEIDFEGAFIEIELCLRVAGKKWHHVELKVVTNYDAENETWDEEIGVLEVERWPGDPDENPTSEDSILVRIDISSQDTYTVIITYSPFKNDCYTNMGNKPIREQLRGANPVWLIAKFPDGTECKKHHAFNVQQSIKKDSGHLNHVEPWEVDLGDHFIGLPFEIISHIIDPGSDDHYLTYTYGSQKVNITYLNNPPNPDLYPSPEINPRNIMDTTTLIYEGPGAVTLIAKDDDNIRLGIGQGTDFIDVA